MYTQPCSWKPLPAGANSRCPKPAQLALSAWPVHGAGMDGCVRDACRGAAMVLCTCMCTCMCMCMCRAPGPPSSSARRRRVAGTRRGHRTPGRGRWIDRQLGTTHCTTRTLHSIHLSMAEREASTGSAGLQIGGFPSSNL
eukprot:scaffold109652_cov45-Phaeocystis_antarctica.AAC.1